MSAPVRKNLVTAMIHFEPVWTPRLSPDPRAQVADLKAQAQEAGRLDREIVKAIASQGSGIVQLTEEFNAEFADVTPARPAPADVPRWQWSWYSDFDWVSVALAGAEPAWDARNGCFWASRKRALSWVKTVSDVARIPTPLWNREPTFWQMMDSRQRWQKAFPDNPPGSLGGGVWSQPAGRKPVRFLPFMSFIDMGPHLLGADEFMMILAGDPPLADALMDKCFELSTSYGEFLQSLQGGTVCGLVGFGGDYTCMLSPDLYEKYSARWDQRLFSYFREFYGVSGETPCNLHSCGPSPHLYSAWGRHPLRASITTLQTRLLPPHVESLRQHLPGTLLQLTFHPGHYDLARVRPDDVRSVFRQTLEDAGRRDVHFTVFAFANNPEDIVPLETNLRVIYEEMKQINSVAGRCEEIPEGPLRIDRC